MTSLCTGNRFLEVWSILVYLICDGLTRAISSKKWCPKKLNPHDFLIFTMKNMSLTSVSKCLVIGLDSVSERALVKQSPS